MPVLNCSSPTYVLSCWRTDAPLGYVMLSKIDAAWATSWMGWWIGCEAGPWSERYARILPIMRWLAQASVCRVARSAAQWQANSANASFSHRSSHQRMVTMLPNHMCAISCSNTRASRPCSAGVGAAR